MKVRLFLSLFVVCALLGGKAIAQGCSAKPLQFPTPSGPNIAYNTNTSFCIASTDSSGTQTGRLRWNNNNAGLFQLFDTDDTGAPLLWCPTDSQGVCLNGGSLCLQADGNLVLYPSENCQGTARWASNTNGQNDDGEELAVTNDLIVAGVHRGEAAVLYNDILPHSDETKQRIWHSPSSD